MVQIAAKIAANKIFQRLVIVAILLSAIVIGFETYPSVIAKYGDALHILDKVILGIFTAEVLIKLLAAGRKPAQYFKDPWNSFDFLIVAICYVPIDAQFVVILRLIRVLRLLKLITALPRLQLIVGALLKSIPSIGYIGILLGLHFYIFAIVGVFTFGGNDPFRFGTLQAALLTLFQIATMENWVELMNTNMYGCDKFGYEGAIQALCVKPEAWSFAAPAYFIVFIIFGTMIILNLFIGVIMKGMEEMEAEMNAPAEGESGASVEERILERLERIEAKLEVGLK